MQGTFSSVMLYTKMLPFEQATARFLSLTLKPTEVAQEATSGSTLPIDLDCVSYNATYTSSNANVSSVVPKYLAPYSSGPCGDPDNPFRGSSKSNRCDVVESRDRVHVPYDTEVPNGHDFGSCVFGQQAQKAAVLAEGQGHDSGGRRRSVDDRNGGVFGPRVELEV